MMSERRREEKLSKMTMKTNKTLLMEIKNLRKKREKVNLISQESYFDGNRNIAVNVLGSKVLTMHFKPLEMTRFAEHM